MADKLPHGHPKRINLQKYLLVLCLTVIIFAAGLWLGNWIAEKKFNALQNTGQDLRTDIMALELQQDLIKADPCKGLGLNPLSQQLYTLGTRLDFMENNQGVNDPEVLRLKQYYSLLEMRHWLFMKEVNSQCYKNNVLILYFYSNKEACPKCDDQGFVLSYLREKYEDVMIYSLDKDMSNVALDTLKKTYNINQAPTIVVNDVIYPGYQTRDFLEAKIEAIHNNTQ